MTMKNASRLGRTLLACSLLTISLSACKTTESVRPSPDFSVPHESTLVLDEVPAPKVVPGMDARVAWKLEQAARKEANKRLRISRSNVREVRLKASAKAK